MGLRGRDELPNLLEVRFLAEREVVEADHVLVQTKEGLDEVRANEAGGPGHDPSLRPIPQLGLHLLEGCHCRLAPIRSGEA